MALFCPKIVRNADQRFHNPQIIQGIFMEKQRNQKIVNLKKLESENLENFLLEKMI